MASAPSPCWRAGPGTPRGPHGTRGAKRRHPAGPGRCLGDVHGVRRRCHHTIPAMVSASHATCSFTVAPPLFILAQYSQTTDVDVYPWTKENTVMRLGVLLP